MESARRVLGIAGKLLLVGLLCMVVLAIIFPVFARSRCGRRVGCWSNLKHLGLALLMYAQDYDGYLPDAAELNAALMPYTKNEHLFWCPDHGKDAGYSLPASLSRAKLPDGEDAERRVVLYEGYGGTVELRHGDGAYYCFADGHVKWSSTLPSPRRNPDLLRWVELGRQGRRR